MKMIPKTIQELKKFMIENCYNNNFYSIDGNIITEGFGIEKWGELYIWFYIERGKKENIKYFRTESEIVEYAYENITKNKFAYSHLIKTTQDIALKNYLVNELEFRKINYWIDEIPTWNNKTFRIFIVGCDINKVKDITNAE